MKYRFRSEGLLPSLSLDCEERVLAVSEPLGIAEGPLVILVRRGRVRHGSEGGKPSQELGRSGWLVFPASIGRRRLEAGREGALLLSLRFDRDPLPLLARSLPAVPFGSQGFGLWRSGPWAIEPGPDDGGVLADLTRSLRSTLSALVAEAGADAVAEGGHAPDAKSPVGKAIPARASRGLALDFAAATTLAGLLAMLAALPGNGNGNGNGTAEAGPAGRVPSEGSSEGPWTIGRLVAWIDTHYEESFSLDEMTARCALNTSDFARRFKAATGCPLFEYLNRRRISRAALLLKDGDLPVIEIAFSVGYNNLSFFNRYFQRLMGQTPTEYRRRNR